MKNYSEHDDPENRKHDRRSAFDKATHQDALRGCDDIDDAKLASTVDKADLDAPAIVQAFAAACTSAEQERPPDLPDGQITGIPVQPSPQK